MIRYLSPCSSRELEPGRTGIYFFDDYGKDNKIIGCWTVIPKKGMTYYVHHELMKLREVKFTKQ